MGNGGEILHQSQPAEDCIWLSRLVAGFLSRCQLGTGSSKGQERASSVRLERLVLAAFRMSGRCLFHATRRLSV
jgi:hypothetical protein